MYEKEETYLRVFPFKGKYRRELRVFGDKITEGMQKEIDYFNKKRS